MKYLITILLSIFIGTSASTQKNINGSWIKVSPTTNLFSSSENPFSAAPFNGHVFSFKEDGRLEINKLNEPSSKKDFETSIQGSKIIISEDGVPFDTLVIIEGNLEELHLFQTKSQKDIYLIRESSNIKTKEIKTFLRKNNFKIIPTSEEDEATDISHYIYKKDHFFMQDEFYKSSCDLEYKTELHEYDFGNILNISLQDGGINYSILVREINDTHIYGDLVTGNLQKIYIEKLDKQEPKIELLNEDLTGSYYADVTTPTHGNPSDIPFIEFIKFILNADQTFSLNIKKSDEMEAHSGNWEISYYDNFSILKLTLLSEEKPVPIFFQIQNLTKNGITLYHPTCNGIPQGDEVNFKKLE